MRTIINGSLYLVISEEYGNGRTSLEIAREAIAGGVDIIQLREKRKSMQELIKLGTGIQELCRSSDVTFIVNDDPMLAKRIGADGVHLGQEDIERFSIGRVRDIIGPDRLIGISTHSVDQFTKLYGEDVNYLAFGPIFPTKTKNYNIGIGNVRKVAGLSHKPVFFIGGINMSNIDSLMAEGAANIALIRGIIGADDISAATKEFKGRIRERKDKAINV